MVQQLKKVFTKNFEAQSIQDNAASAFRQLSSNPIINGRLVEDVSLGGTDTLVEHKLGREPLGWIVVSGSSATIAYESSTANVSRDKYILLRGSVDTDWASFTPVVDAVTTAPTLGTGSGLTQNGYWRKAGIRAEVSIEVAAGDTSNAAGSGVYLFNLPSGMLVDDTKIRTVAAVSSTTAIEPGDGTVVGFGNAWTPAGTFGTVNGVVQVLDGELGSVVLAQGTNPAATTGLDRCKHHGQGFGIDFATNDFGYTLNFSVPVSAWPTGSSDSTVNLWVF